jgi:signal transduction histidine kinase
MSGLAAMAQVAQARRERARGRIAVRLSRLDLRRSYGVRFLVLVAAYYAAAHVGYAFRFAGPVASVVWLPVGVGIAGLYLFGLSLWPAVIVGDLLVNNYSALPVGAAVGQSFGNLLEIVIGAALLRRVAARNAPLATTSGVAGMIAALAAATFVSAVVGTLSLTLGHVAAWRSAVHVWQTWWLGDFCGAIIVVSLVLAFSSPSPKPWLRGHGVEATLLLVTLVVLSTIAIHGGHQMSYLAFPALIWAALRFGARGTTLAVATGAAFSIWGATHMFGPFGVQAFTGTLLYIQFYLAVTAVSALAVVALASERELLSQNVRASRTRIVVAADEERRRLEHNLHDGAQQRLVALAVRLARVAREAREHSGGTAAEIDAAKAEVLTAIDELRELVQGIRPAALRQFGLARAVEAVAARSDTPMELGELPQVRLDETAETTAYYVVLEAVTNAERYARASRIRVRAHLTGPSLRLEVDDDGVGGAVERGTLGLQGLTDRVEATGGRLIVDSELGRGTRIWAEIPATVTPVESDAAGWALSQAAPSLGWPGTARLP